MIAGAGLRRPDGMLGSAALRSREIIESLRAAGLGVSPAPPPCLQEPDGSP
jgi:hypothetical protein